MDGAIVQEMLARGDVAAAERRCRQILATGVFEPTLFLVLGAVVGARGELDVAEQNFRCAGILDPGLRQAYGNLAKSCWRRGGADQAERYAGQAIVLAPGRPDAIEVRGLARVDLGKPASVDLAWALVSRPDSTSAWLALAISSWRQREQESALRAFARALVAAVDQRLIFERVSALLVAETRRDDVSASRLMTIHRRAGRLFGLVPRRARRRRPIDLDPERRLRIGYIGAAYRSHVVADALLPVVENHDRGQVEVHLFGHEPNPDEVTETLRQGSDGWARIEHLDDDSVSELVVERGIDILVQTMGHWRDNRLAVLARRPAPIQVSYLNNSPTTGLEAVDYMFADKRHLIGDMAAACSEGVIPLPTNCCFNPALIDRAPTLGPPIERAETVFASFNDIAKLTPGSIALFARVLAAVPGSTFLLKHHGRSTENAVRDFLRGFAAAGVEEERIRIVGWLPSGSYLSLYEEVDIVLDSHPFSGGRTTLDAAIMGVPVVSLAGEAPSSRFSTAILADIGFPDLSTDCADAYVKIAIDLARSPERRLRFRQVSRDRLRASPSFDTVGHTRQLEAAYRSMWRRYVATACA